MNKRLLSTQKTLKQEVIIGKKPSEGDQPLILLS
ncbi:hypothetical protein L195_g040312, partial [Trifolium pratense]